MTMKRSGIYDQIEDVVQSSEANKVGAWFGNGSYDGQRFGVPPAFFTDHSALEKIAEHLDGSGAVDRERFEAFKGTTSLLVPPGEHNRVVVKFIHPRVNEVLGMLRSKEYQA